MIGIFFKKDLLDSLKTWIASTAAVLLLFVAMYFSSTLLGSNGNLIMSQSYGMFVNLIPLIYLIQAGNNLIVKKVDDGSFYLEMVSPYPRWRILLTKMIYYILSLMMVYLLLLLAGVICYAIKPVDYLTQNNLLLLNLMSFLLNLSLSSIIFFSSCFFNAYRHALLVGAGVPLISYAFNTISGMFTNIPGLEDNTLINLLVKLKYVSFHTLFSFTEIIAGSNYNFIGIGVFLAVSAVFYGLSFFAFCKKDLPL